MKPLFHLFLTTSLVFVGEITTALLLQFLFLISFQRELFLFYLLMVLFGVTKIFVTAIYPLYFANLFFFLYIVWKKHLLSGVKDIFKILFYGTIFIFLYYYFDTFRYDIYIASGIEDSVHPMDGSVALLLTWIHLIILFLFIFL